MDYEVKASASGHFSVSVKMRMPCLPTLLTARLFSDQQLTADGDWKASSRAIWSQERFLPTTDAECSLEASTNVNNFTLVEFSDQIAAVEQWTAETPNLYTLVLEEKQPACSIVDIEQKSEEWDRSNFKTTQVESCRVGFRTIDTRRGILCCNSKKIMIYGINRHEHDPDHGKVVSLERMKQDITILKRNNFNAVRTSHYPAHSSFYKLCDFYGMYVCDEANIETHGMKPMGRLAHDKVWEHTFVERVRRMVQRDHNHPCIIMWSLGNESGRGRNLSSARKALLNLDNSRPICYESGGSWSEGIGRTELTDIVCPMYPNVGTILETATDSQEDRPLILCEYSHSMNNSNGNLHLYWDAFRKFERLQGGFIWDMLDQGLRKRAKDGRSFFGYGGDFGVNKPSDRQFCINGMFSPDRKPHPSVSEIKYLQQPVDVEVMGSTKNDVHVLYATNQEISKIHMRIKNLYDFNGLSHLSWRWKFHCNFSGDLLFKGETSNEDEFVTLDLSSAMDKIRLIEGNYDNFFEKIYYVDMEGFLNKDYSWAMRGHVVARKQIPLMIRFNDLVPASIREKDQVKNQVLPLSVTSDEYWITIKNGNDPPFVTIDKANGYIQSVAWDGTSILCDAVRPNFLRASTDNDKGGMELVLEFLLLSWAAPIFRLVFGDSKFSYESNWNRRGLGQDLPPEPVCRGVSIMERHDDIVKIKAFTLVRSKETGTTVIEQESIYDVYRDGRISIANKVKTLEKTSSLPRIGLSFRLNPAFYNIRYFGRGPLENYPDRKSGSHFGWWKTSPSKMGYDYIVPSENGSRSDCQQICFESDNHEGIAIIADSRTSFSCSALLHSTVELHRASHTCDLDQRFNGVHPIYVNIDHKLMGVGGDNSWSPCVYPDFIVSSPQEYEYKVWLKKFPL